MSKKETETLTEIIERYRANYYRKCHQYPSYIPLTPREFDRMVTIIREFIASQKNDDGETFYYEDNGEQILQWKSAELYVSYNAKKQRDSIQEL